MKKMTGLIKNDFYPEGERNPPFVFLFLFGLLIGIPWTGAGWAMSDSETVTLSFNIQPVTVVKATSSGAQGVNIGPVVPGVDASSEPLEVLINTNTNERYRVYHEVRNRPTSGSGGQFPAEEIKFMAGNGAQGGTSAIPALVPVPDGRALIFESGSEGGADRFSLRYAVASRKSFGAGDYYGDIYLDVEPA